MNKHVKQFDWRCFAIAFVMYILLYPYFVWGIMSNVIVNLLLNVLVSVVLLRFCKKITFKDYHLIVLYEVIWLLFLFLNFFVHGVNFNGIVAQLPICLYISTCIVEAQKMKNIINYLINISVSISAIGLFFFMISIIGVSLPNLGTVTHMTNANRTYTVFPFYVVENQVVFVDFFRFSGVFNEAGLLGTLCVFFLIILNFEFKDWRTWICLLTGVFTFSFFFYAMMIVYWTVNSIKVKSFKIVMLVFILFGGFYFTTKDNPVLYSMIWKRFEWDKEEHQFKGDNRMDESADYAYQQLKGSSEYWLGLSGQNRDRYWANAYGSSSYKNVVANNGMFFFALYVIFFMLLGWYYRGDWISFLTYALMLILCLYQRSDIYSLTYMFLFACIARRKEYV